MSGQTTAREQLAKEYDAIHNRLFVLQMVLVALLLALYQFTGASATLANSLAARFGDGLWWAANASYTVISVFGFSACMFPLSYYSGHVIEHHYELSNETFGEWLADFVKSLLIDLVLATILFSVIYALLRWMPNFWWLFATVFYILFGVVLSTLMPVVIMPLFHKFEPLEEGDLTQAVREMMEEAGIKVVGVFKWGLQDKTNTANAAFAGFGRTKRIILGDTLLSGYTQEEILAILAHEVGHYKNRDTLRLMVTSSALALAGFYISDLCLNGLSGWLGFESIANIGAAPLFIFSLFVFSLVSMPFANLHSRQREFAADAYAVEKLGSHDALVSAFEKLADQNLSNKEPAAWVEFMLHSHPSISRRIERARSQ
ncbi:M48 family metallopeptidase [Pontiella sulfatireligans]|uniref:Protease HtpX n=1 Tax=Pontiella sulfatireligans TaxID=2750658 RepID=A0A6C2UJU0_9BACT|nr:M48 family metallopeptidase [Pontiella sulfatireligans]VGO20368.1 Protease HtpX [Pontiella sulfatireligans]